MLLLVHWLSWSVALTMVALEGIADKSHLMMMALATMSAGQVYSTSETSAEQLSARAPVVQLAHAAPETPHAAAVGGAVQLPAAQQPFAQDVPSQTHAPATQRWPLTHEAAPPHRQAPAVQLSALVASQLTQ